jgi:hypothetical protein
MPDFMDDKARQKVLEDQSRAYMTAYMAVMQSYPTRQKEADLRAGADKRFAAGLMKVDAEELTVLYGGYGDAAAGLFRGEIIGYANHKVFQQVDENTVVAHYETAKLNGSRVGEVMEIDYSDQKKSTRTMQSIQNWNGERCCHLTKSEAEEEKDASKEKDTGKSKGMGR